MDHGLCFIRSGEDLTTKLSHIDKVKDARVYGAFPEFVGRLRTDMIDKCVRKLHEVTQDLATQIVQTIPQEWDVSVDVRKALAEMIYRRAGFVADNVEQWIDRGDDWFGRAGAAP